ncbi:hypothetical protein QUB10_28255 [Microcoleus sp. B5-D4]
MLLSVNLSSALWMMGGAFGLEAVGASWDARLSPIKASLSE